MSSLGDRVKEARDSLGITQTEFARRLGCDQSLISRLESGDYKGTENLIDIALETGYSPFWLAKAKGPKKMSTIEASIHNLDDAEQRAVLAFIEYQRRLKGGEK